MARTLLLLLSLLLATLGMASTTIVELHVHFDKDRSELTPTAVAQLGWINCDRFINLPESQKYQVITKGDTPKQTEAFVVFTKMRSILQMGRNGWG
ncbi:MAG: hypothetical protein ACK46C_08160, partial [Flavobacteriales bacterium]